MNRIQESEMAELIKQLLSVKSPKSKKRAIKNLFKKVLGFEPGANVVEEIIKETEKGDK